MRRALALLLAFCIANPSLLVAASSPPVAKSASQDENYSYEAFSPEQLDNLLAPIALYPDPLLSQVLVAATFVDDVDEAARWVRAYGTNGIDDQPWDVSVKAVAHYPTVIYMMADKIDWTTTLGQAYVNQSSDVMMSVQRLRRMAYSVGNLVTTPQQQVIVEPDYISIVPYQAQYIYVPVYDPSICYYRRPFWGVAITFGAAFLIGAWLNRDCDWHNHRIYYHGWNGPGWINRGRPYIQVNNVYVNNRYNNVIVNRGVFRRNVNVNNIDRYNSVHRDVNYRNIQNNNARLDRLNNVRPPEGSRRPPVNNKIINRNIDTTNPRLDQYRGREGTAGPSGPPQAPPQPSRPQVQPQPQPLDQYRGREGAARPSGPPQAPPQPSQPQVQPQPQPARPAPAQPTRPTAPSIVRPSAEPQPTPHVFGRPQGNFDPRAASQRGQSSRQEMSKPSPTPRPAPQPQSQSKPAPAPRGGERSKP
jgi:Protein of unknown function (DUF3300)